MKRFIWLLNIVLVLSLAIGCRPAPMPTPEPLTVRIGFAGDLSGGGAYLTSRQLDVVSLAVEQFNKEGYEVAGCPVNLELMVEDDMGDPARAAMFAQKLTDEDRVVAVIGHSSEATSLAAAPVYGANNVVMVCPSVTAPSLTAVSENVYRIAPNETQRGSVAASLIYGDLGRQTVALVYMAGWFEETMYTFVEAFDNLGGEVRYQGTLREDRGNIEDIFYNLQQKEVDAIAYIGLPVGAADLLKRFASEGVRPPLLVGLRGLWNQAYLEEAGEFAEGTYAVVPGQSINASPKSTRFLQTLREVGLLSEGEQPDPFVPMAFDAVAFIITAVLEGDNHTPQGVLESMKLFRDEESTYVGTTGDLRFADYSGDLLESHFCLHQVRDGQWMDAMPVYPFDTIVYEEESGIVLTSWNGGNAFRSAVKSNHEMLTSSPYNYARLKGGDATAAKLRILGPNTWPKGATYCHKPFFWDNFCMCQFYLELKCVNSGNVSAEGCWERWYWTDKCVKDPALAKDYTQWQTTTLMSAVTAGCPGTDQSCSDNEFCRKEKVGFPCYDQANAGCFKYQNLPKSGKCVALTYLTPPTANMGLAPKPSGLSMPRQEP
jgi:branched-chain amino acid transport system substrate-binding protein